MVVGPGMVPARDPNWSSFTGSSLFVHVMCLSRQLHACPRGLCVQRARLRSRSTKPPRSSVILYCTCTYVSVVVLAIHTYKCLPEVNYDLTVRYIYIYKYLKNYMYLKFVKQLVISKRERERERVSYIYILMRARDGDMEYFNCT